MLASKIIDCNSRRVNLENIDGSATHVRIEI